MAKLFPLCGKPWLGVVYFILLVPSALASDCPRLEAVSWLLGDWQHSNDSLIIGERWQRISPTTFEGLGTSEPRTEAEGSQISHPKSSESLRLVQMSDEVFYLAKVTSNPLPVAFKLTQCTDTLAVFTNPAHDFPQTLSYQLHISAQGDRQLKVKVFAAHNPGFEVDFKARTSRP